MMGYSNSQAIKAECECECGCELVGILYPLRVVTGDRP